MRGKQALAQAVFSMGGELLTLNGNIVKRWKSTTPGHEQHVPRCSGWESAKSGDFRNASMLFADNVVLLASSDRNLQHTLGQFALQCQAVGMKVSTSKSESGGLLPSAWE